MAMGMIIFMMTHDATSSVWLAFLAALATGVFIGWLNGIIVVKFGIPSLVATIGTQFFWRGAVLVLGQGKSGTLVYTKETLLHPLLVGKIGGQFPMQMIWLVLITILAWVLLNRHRFGAHVFLIGDNAKSAELMGINTGRTRIVGFILIGLVAAFAGVAASLHVTYFWPSLGDGYLLRTLASVFLGGTSVFGGVGTIFGTIVGAFIIGSIEAGTVAIGLTGFWTQLIYGLIIVLSVIMHTYVRKRMEYAS
jgi:simple sugar transport system permease protein